MAQDKKPATVAPRRNRRTMGLLIAIVGAVVAVTMLPTTIVLLVGMMPTAVAYFVDTSRERSLGPTVLFLNFAGVLPSLFKLWQRGHALPNSLEIIMQPFSLLMMFLPAAFGWLLYFYVPMLVVGVLRRNAESRIKRIEKDQEYLAEQWGSGVTSGVPVTAMAPPPAEKEESKADS